MITVDVTRIYRVELRPGALPAILRRLAEELGLEGEDVVEDPIDAPALEAVLGDHPRVLELCAQQGSKRAVDPRSSTHLGLLEQLQTAVECELPEPVLANAHVPSTSTLPASVTRTLTRSRCGSE